MGIQRVLVQQDVFFPYAKLNRSVCTPKISKQEARGTELLPYHKRNQRKFQSSGVKAKGQYSHIELHTILQTVRPRHDHLSDQEKKKKKKRF